jgi:hypothetical protein
LARRIVPDDRNEKRKSMAMAEPSRISALCHALNQHFYIENFVERNSVWENFMRKRKSGDIGKETGTF